uniref:LIM zinc-binding domain-containing protein n=1 Tax=Capra hircus TaxID=9925 RepID=A0A8C2S729_CAPHI
MLLEKQELNEPLRQPTSFLVLQEILESEEKGDPNKLSGLRSVKAPVTKGATLTRNARKLLACDKCGTSTVSVSVKLREHHSHPKCYVCANYGSSLKQKGHFFVEDQIYCGKHAQERICLKSMPGGGSLHPRASKRAHAMCMCSFSNSCQGAQCTLPRPALSVPLGCHLLSPFHDHPANRPPIPGTLGLPPPGEQGLRTAFCHFLGHSRKQGCCR